MSILKPQCLDFPNIVPAAYTSDGYILPCCWIDNQPNHEQLISLGLKDKELLLSNVDEIDDIYTSKQWEDFFQLISNCDDRSKLIPSCVRKCGKQ